MILVREGVKEHLRLIAAMAMTEESVLLLVLSIKWQLKEMILIAVSAWMMHYKA